VKQAATGAPLVWSKWQWRGLVTFSIVIFLFSMAASLSHIVRATGQLRDWPVEPQLVIEAPPGTPTGWSLVKDVPPESAAVQAGIRVGDLVRSDLFGVEVEAPVVAAGVRLPVTVERGGVRFATAMIAPVQPFLPPGSGFVFGSQGFAGVVWATLGLALLLMRGRRDRAAAIFGTLMICVSWTAGGFGFVWASSIFMLQLRTALGICAAAGICLFLPLAGLELAGSGASERERRLVRGVSVLLAVFNAVSLVADLAGFDIGLPMFIASVIAAAIVCFWTIARQYRQNDARGRNRIKIVVLAFATYISSLVLFGIFIARLESLEFLWLIFASVTVGLFGPVLMAYAILRQRLFDFGFAVNRTLVYGAAAFTLLITFGLVEYIAKSMIPVAWPTAGPFISAGIAVLLFLSFHRLHHWFEHHIERFFFKEWQEAEKALKRFVHSASHFNKTPALCASAIEAVSKFARGSNAALFLRETDGSYRLASGKLAGAPKRFADDNSAFALMRAERKPLDLTHAPGSLTGAMAFPMVEQGALTGFILLGARPDGAHYRPDQVELLDWAVHHIGLDLRALHARQLEAQVVSLGEKLAWAEKQFEKRAKPKPA